VADLADFRAAQDLVWDRVTSELRAGRKTSHWIWYVFPQLASLGRSHLARHYGITDLDEATAYLADPVLRARLEEVAGLLLTHNGTDPEDILGDIDALKVRSSMTLFEAAANAPPVFADVLDDLYQGTRCPMTQAEILP
jgi:uncharacterized protein (DUF1810 family)